MQNLTPSPRQLDLLQYQGGRAALLLDGVTLPAGDYEWIRLIVDNEPGVRDSYIVLTGGEECELRVPSGAESGLKLNRGFTLPADGSVALTIDFDLRKSIHAPPGQQRHGRGLHAGLPDAPDAAHRGRRRTSARSPATSTARWSTEECLPKVYVFSGSGVTPDDIEEATGADADPLVVAGVAVENGSTAYRVSRRVPAARAYTVAFTCDDDDADRGRHAHLHGRAERDGADESHQHGGFRRAGELERRGAASADGRNGRSSRRRSRSTSSSSQVLLAQQHPNLATLPLRAGEGGFDNYMFRLGESFAVRLPRSAAAARLLANEQNWLITLSDRLPLQIPVPIRVGQPGFGFPWRWSVVPWLAGATAEVAPVQRTRSAAPRCIPARAARAGAGRCAAQLRSRRAAARAVPPRSPSACSTSRRTTDVITDRIRDAWREALEAPNDTPPTWIHGDLHARNVLTLDGTITGVIDWGDMTCGDPAIDLACLWMLLPDEAARERSAARLRATEQRALGARARLGRSLRSHAARHRPGRQRTQCRHGRADPAADLTRAKPLGSAARR